jgi:hypothetical protein
VCDREQPPLGIVNRKTLLVGLKKPDLAALRVDGHKRALRLPCYSPSSPTIRPTTIGRFAISFSTLAINRPVFDLAAARALYPQSRH